MSVPFKLYIGILPLYITEVLASSSSSSSRPMTRPVMHAVIYSSVLSGSGEEDLLNVCVSFR